MITITWVTLGAGKLALTHRPKINDINKLSQQGCQRVISIQGEHEKPQRIGQAVLAAGMQWLWIKVGNAKFPEGEVDVLLRCGLQEARTYLQAGESILIHCSAGIHRTGMFAFALLRQHGLSETEALANIATMRLATRDGMQPKHREWGNQVVKYQPA